MMEVRQNDTPSMADKILSVIQTLINIVFITSWVVMSLVVILSAVSAVVLLLMTR